MDHYTRMVLHVAKLAETPGWRGYAKDWAEQLEQCKSGAWRGLVAAVRLQLASSSVQQKNGGFKPQPPVSVERDGARVLPDSPAHQTEKNSSNRYGKFRPKNSATGGGRLMR